MPKSKVITGVFLGIITLIFILIIGFISINSNSGKPKTSEVESATDELQAFSTTTPTPTPIAMDVPRLTVISEPVQVKLSGKQFQPAQNEAQIFAGTKIKTDKGGRAILSYSNGSITRIDENTQITIARLQNTSNFFVNIFIEQGRIWSNIVNLKNQEGYETKTAMLSASSTGGSFGHTYGGTEKKDTVISLQEEASVNCLNKTQAQKVNSGEKGIFTCLADTKPVINKLTNTDLADSWIIFNKKEDEKLALARIATPTPAPSASAEPSKTPSTKSPVIVWSNKAVECSTAKCTVYLYGDNFTAADQVSLVNQDTKKIYSASVNSIIYKPPNNIEATFSNLSKGNYYITVKNDSGEAKSSPSFTI